MEGARVHSNIFRKKSRLVIDNRFDFVNNLQAGDKGQLNVNFVVDRVVLEEDDDFNEKMVVTFKVVEAEKFEPRKEGRDAS